MSNNNITTSIIVPTYNSSMVIERTLTALRRSQLSNFEIIVVDDCSKDSTQTILKKYKKFNNIRLIFQPKNRGASVARNTGARQAKGKYLVFIDADVVPKKDCVSLLISLFDKDECIGMTQGALLDQKTKKIESYGHYLTIMGFPYDLPKLPKQMRKPIYRTFGTRAIYSYRRSVFLKIKGQDEDYIFHGEDTDLSWRVALAGYKTYFITKAQGIHYHIDYKKRNIDLYSFSEGSKNQISNILKNSSDFLLLPMLFLNILTWLVVSLKMLAAGKTIYFKGIYKGIFWNITHISRTLKKRRDIKRYTSENNDTIAVMFGPLNIFQILAKGLRWFSHV